MEWWVLLHVATAFWFVAGLAGRDVLTIRAVTWLLVALIMFLTMIPLVPLVFLPRGKVFDAALGEAVAAGEVTPSLRAAFADPVVNGARWYERIVVAVIILLMVTKPF